MVENNSHTSENEIGNIQTQGFLRLFLKNQPRIYGFILAMVSNWSDADDIMQETTEVMWRKFQEFEPNTDFAAWGIKIARYKILEFRRERQNKPILSDQSIQAIFDNLIEVKHEDDERLIALQHCLGKLSDRDRRLIRLRYEQNITTKELAKRVNRPFHGLYKAMGRIHSALLLCVRRTLSTKGIA